MATDMKIKEAILGYMTVLNISEFQDQLSPEEHKIGAQNIIGCLCAIEDRLYEQGDQASLSLASTIQEREKINGRIHDINDKSLVESTRYCAEKVFNYYAKTCR